MAWPWAREIATLSALNSSPKRFDAPGLCQVPGHMNGTQAYMWTKKKKKKFLKPWQYDHYNQKWMYDQATKT